MSDKRINSSYSAIVTNSTRGERQMLSWNGVLDIRGAGIPMDRGSVSP